MSELEEHINRPNGFKIPDNFFKEFRTNLTYEINKKEKTPSINTWLSIAASICAIVIFEFAITYFNNSDINTESDDYLLSKIGYLNIEIEDIYLSYSETSEYENAIETEEAKALFAYEAIDIYDFPFDEQ